MSGALLRKNYAKKFFGMSRYSRTRGWLMVSLYLVQIFAGVALGHYLLGLQAGTWVVLAIVADIVFIGTRLRGINNIVHECSHSSFCERREDNVTVGRFCSALLTGGFTKYKENHLSHHAHLGDYEQDREFMAIRKFRLHDPLTPRTILRHAVTPLLGLHIPYYSGISLSVSDGPVFATLKFAVVFLMVFFTVIEPWTTILFVVVPLFFMFPALNYWTDCLDHAGLVGETDELEASRNVLAPSLVRLVFFPRNDCYHLVHHLFPNVPAQHLKDAHVILSGDSAYRQQPQATRPLLSGFAKTLRPSLERQTN